MPQSLPPDLHRRPLLLRHDNFTPPSRTPWGGTRIVAHCKRGLMAGPEDAQVGESWEVSVEPSFPSRLLHQDLTLAELIASAPEAWLGAEVAARYNGQTPLLIKLLDTAAPLSVQVHPADNDPRLEPGESGKPESWLVLHARPGAGIYLGWRQGIDRAQVQACLEEGAALDRLLNFIPVEAGEMYVIRAGTPHSIGAGVTLVEPQLVRPGLKGVTCRFWDWGRRYDAAGQPSDDGELRPLHVARSMAFTDWSAPRGEAFVATCRPQARVLLRGPIERTLLANEPWFVVERWRGSGALPLSPPGTMLALLCLRGEATLETKGGSCRLRRGQSAVIPAAAGALKVLGDDLDLVVVSSPIDPPDI